MTDEERERKKKEDRRREDGNESKTFADLEKVRKGRITEAAISRPVISFA